MRKIILSTTNVATKLFLWKAPTEMGNSPINNCINAVRLDFSHVEHFLLA